MSKFYITTEVEDDKIVGVVYNKNTNTKVYKTQKHAVQQDAINEANMYLRTNSFVTSPVAATNQSLPQPPRRCCGR